MFLLFSNAPNWQFIQKLMPNQTWHANKLVCIASVTCYADVFRTSQISASCDAVRSAFFLNLFKGNFFGE
jgi:hypothetical protein